MTETDQVGCVKMQKWFEELDRLVAAATERFACGDMLPVLASLAAVPSVRMMLVEHCREALDEQTRNAELDNGIGTGLYL